MPIWAGRASATKSKYRKTSERSLFAPSARSSPKVKLHRRRLGFIVFPPFTTTTLGLSFSWPLTKSHPLHQKSSKNVEPKLKRRKRSEEQTSVLQSLMRISYAVFSMKKQKKRTSNNKTKHT